VVTTDSFAAGLSVTDMGDLTYGKVEIPSDTISFLISVSDNTSQTLGVGHLANPQGTELLSGGSMSGFVGSQESYGNALVPIRPEVTPDAGNWTFQVGGTSTNYTKKLATKLTLRRGTLPDNATLIIQPYLTGSSYGADNLTAALAVLKSIYAGAGIQVTLNSTKIIDNSSFSTISDDFNNTNTSALVSQGSKNVINLFFAEDVSSTTGGVLGIAAGIPGSLGIAGNRNGVLIGLSAHLSGSSLNDQLLGETAAHEMGHFLGLFHTTESSGSSHDPLSDTPECTKSSASANNCVGSGTENLMFWSAWSGGNQTTLSQQQADVIARSPIAQ